MRVYRVSCNLLNEDNCWEEVVRALVAGDKPEVSSILQQYFTDKDIDNELSDFCIEDMPLTYEGTVPCVILDNIFGGL